MPKVWSARAAARRRRSALRRRLAEPGQPPRSCAFGPQNGCVELGRERAAARRSPAANSGAARPAPRHSAQRDVRHRRSPRAGCSTARAAGCRACARRAARPHRRCTFSLMTSFSSPNWISSGSLPSSARVFSRRASIWRSASGIAWPPCGCGTEIRDSSSAYSSKKTGIVLGGSARRRQPSAQSISISPSNTVTAGPGHGDTGLSAPAQRSSNRRRASRRATGESSRPRRMPATTAAQAPVPQASVSPAPRS